MAIDKFSKNSDIIKFGLISEQAEELNMREIRKGNEYKDKSLFDVISENSPLKSSVTNETLAPQSTDNHSSNKIADMLVDAIFRIGTGNLEEAINQIDSDNIIDVLSLYQEKANQKNSIVNFKYDNESLFEAILDESISKNTKRQYLEKLTENLVHSIHTDSETSEYFKSKFKNIIDNALSRAWPNQSAKEIDQLVNELLMLNKKEVHDNTFNRIHEKIYNLDEKINLKDFTGNGNIDNPAKQLTGNCRAHALINAIIVNPNGKKYLNSLITKDLSTGNITVCLPGAKEIGYPKPQGDGKYTYTESQILKNIGNVDKEIVTSDGDIRSFATSIGDGDETALLMAMQDFLTEQETLPAPDLTLQDFKDDDYIKALYGDKDLPKVCILPDELSDSDPNILRSHLSKLEKIKQVLDFAVKEEKYRFVDKTKEELIGVKINKTKARLVRSKIANKEKIKYLKELFYSGNCILTLGIPSYMDISNIQQIGTNGNLLTKHAYAIQSIENDKITLIESNNPKHPIKLGTDDFFNTFTIVFRPLPM